MEYKDYLDLQERLDRLQAKWDRQKEEKIAKRLAENPNWKPKEKRKKVRQPELNAYNEYRTTTNSSVFKKLHKELYASCSLDRWHNSWDNDTWEYYGFQIRDSYDYKGRLTKAGEGRYPNWKLVSKNKKQWMKKPIKLIVDFSNWAQEYDDYADIIWKVGRNADWKYNQTISKYDRRRHFAREGEA